MNLRLHLLPLFFLLSPLLPAQTELGFEPGLQHLRMLDRHASPLVYQSTGINLGLSYRKEKENSLLRVKAVYMNSQLEPAERNLYRYDFGGDKNTTAASLSVDYFRQDKQNASIWWGAGLNYNVLVDFEGVANFPWATLYGDIGLTVRKDITVGERVNLEIEAGIPLAGLITRQPYNYIPRIQGEEPGVPSLIKLGTKVATWNNYQRVNFGVSGKIKLGERWTLRPAYRFHWARYTQPATLQLYRQEVVVGLMYNL